MPTHIVVLHMQRQFSISSSSRNLGYCRSPAVAYCRVTRLLVCREPSCWRDRPAIFLDYSLNEHGIVCTLRTGGKKPLGGPLERGMRLLEITIRKLLYLVRYWKSIARTATQLCFGLVTIGEPIVLTIGSKQSELAGVDDRIHAPSSLLVSKLTSHPNLEVSSL